MLEIDPAPALVDVSTAMKKGTGLGKGTRSGHEAAVATVQLMFNAQKRLSPKQIIDADDPALSPKARATALWANKHVREATIQSLADSVKLLANLWQSAWTQGGGSSIPATQLRVFTEAELENVYRH